MDPFGDVGPSHPLLSPSPNSHLLQQVLCKFVWSCPVCLGICSCSACRKKGATRPYQPKGTFLGAPTKHVADPRSVETLVDFARGNLGWIKNPAEIMPGKRKRASTSDTAHNGLNHGQVPIDPALDDKERPGPSGFTAINSPSETPFADVEGRFLPASTEGGGGTGSNSFDSVQAHLLIAQQPRIKEEEARVGGLNQNQGFLHGEPDAMGRGAEIGFAAGRTMPTSHRNRNVSNQTHHPPLGSNVAPRGGRLPDDQSRTAPSLTALESNPLAFVAAAGLRLLPGDDSNQWGDTTPMASQPPRELCIQTCLLERRPSPSPGSAAPAPAPEPSPPRLLPRRPRVKTALSFGLNSLRPERESQIGDWVQKTKVANRWAKNLKKKCLVVTLRPPLERFGALVDELLEREKVTSDLFSTVPQARSGSAADSEREESPPREEAKRKRGGPKKIDHNIDPLSDPDEASFSDTRIGGSSGPGRNKQAQRRQFLSSPHHGAAKQEVLTVLKHQPRQFKELETEEDMLAREECKDEERQRRVAEEEAVRIQREREEAEKAALEAERLRVRSEEEAALEAERLRIRAEEKAARKAARAKLRAEKKVQRRREADRNAKLVAAGVLASSDVEEYFSEPYSTSESESDAAEEPQTLDATDDSYRMLIPHDWSFAVIIDRTTNFGGWRDSYTFLDLPLDRSPLSPRGRPSEEALLPSRSNSDRSATLSPAGGRGGHRQGSVPHGVDASFGVGGVAPSPSGEWDRRQSAVDVKKYSFGGQSEDESAVVVAKKRRIRRVEVKPGKWAEAEITESEDEGSGDDVVPAQPPAEPGINEWEAMDLGGGTEKERSGERQQEEQENAEGMVMEVGDEYERRWNRENRRRWF